MSNEPIKPIEQNYVPLEELFPNLVVGGVEVDDNISSVTKTWSSSKINTELGTLNSNLTQAIEDIDLSPYEQTANKSTDGTLADNSDTKYPSQKAVKTYVDKKQDLLFDGDFVSFSPQNGYFYHDSFVNNGTPNTGYIIGNVTGSGAVNIGTITLNGGSTQTRKPVANIASNGIGVAVLSYATNSCQLNSTSSIANENHISLRTETATGYTSVYVGLSNTSAVSAFPTTDILTGSGLFWRWNPTLNSAKWQLVKVISGVTTVLLDTDYTIANDIIYKLGIKYIKSTDTAYFYYDRVLIHTQIYISLPNNIETIPVCAINTSNAQAVNKMIHWHQTSWLFKYA